MAEEVDDVLATSRDLRLAVGRLARAIRRAFNDADNGLAFLELGVLNRLDRDGPTHPGELSEGEGVTTPAIAATLRRLEELGFVERARDPEDGRKVVVTLTPAGREAMANRHTAVHDRLHQILFDDLTAADRAGLRAAIPLLEKVAAKL